LAVFLPFLPFFLDGEATTGGGFGGSGGVSNFSSFFSKAAYSFLNEVTSLLKNSSLSVNCYFIFL